MNLTFLKHSGSWDHTARIFKIHTTSFEKLITKSIRGIFSAIYEKLVIAVLNILKMKSVVDGGRAFKNFPCARYATNVKFQQAFRPSGSMQEGKK